MKYIIVSALKLRLVVIIAMLFDLIIKANIFALFIINID